MRSRPTRRFFERPAHEVARELVGMSLQRRLPDGTTLIGRLVETEAYLGDGSDPGSHSHRGITPRNRSMFGPPGRLYVYRSYGIHIRMNVVCGTEGDGAAVLLRAVEPLSGIATMRTLRGLEPARPDRLIARGPGRLAQAFGVALDHDGADLLRGQFAIAFAQEPCAATHVETSRRVGLTKGANLRLRFYDRDNPWVSPWRPGKARRKGKKG